MSLPVQNLAHAKEGLARLIEQYKGLPNIAGILTSYLNRVQDLENAIWDVINSRVLDNATASQLDMIGKIVGEARLGRADGDFKQAIRIRVMCNRSQGEAEDILSIASRAFADDVLFQGSIQYADGNDPVNRPAQFSLVVTDVLTDQQAIQVPVEFLHVARMGGVRGEFVYTRWTPFQDLLLDDATNPGGGTFLDDAVTPGQFTFYAASSKEF